MTGISVGCMQIAWNKFIAQDREKWPEERVLAEIAQAGYEGAAASPRAGRSPQETVALYTRHGLKPVPGYLGAKFWESEARTFILEEAKRHSEFARGVGCREWFVAAGFGYVTASGRTRQQLAGHVSGEDAMSDAEYERFAQVLNEVGAIMLQQGVRACFHNHVGTVIETREEIDRLLALTDPELVFLGPDTGHLAWAGADVTAFCRDYSARIKTMHLKDINLEVRERGRKQAWDYQTAESSGIFAELGEGFIDFPEVFAILRDAGFVGWVLAETDVTQKPTALESVTISRNYLKGLGV